MNFEEKHCPHCGALLVENASFCPYCESVLIEKRPAEMPKPKRHRRITAALLLAAILVVTLTAVGFADHGKVIDAQGAELIYEADGQTFHLALSFESQGGAPFFGQPLFTVEVREDQVRGQVSSSRVFVDNGGGVAKKNEFLALVDHYEVTTTPCDGITLLQIDETCIPTNSNAAIEAIPSYHTEQLKEGEGNVIWTIYLKNGDTLRLRHTVKITRVPVVMLTENDYPMATIDDLNELLDTLAQYGAKGSFDVIGDIRGWTDDEKFLLRSGRQRGRHDLHRHGDDCDARHSPLEHHERPLYGRRHGHRPFRERRSIPAPLHV